MLVLGDFGQPYLNSQDGCLELRVDYAQPVPALDWSGPILTTTDHALLCRCPTPRVGDVLEERTLLGPEGVSITTRFYWPPPVLLAAGYTAPLSRFVETMIRGLSAAPIVLTDEYSQTYRPEHHNFAEHFLFEPALAPDLPPAQRAELDARGIRAIHVRYSFGSSEFTYFGNGAWGGACLGCTGFDADRDGACTGAPTYDCADGDPSVWAAPGEVSGVAFTTRTNLAWSAPAAPGAAAVRYDAIRSTIPADFVTPAFCVASDVTSLAAGAPGIPSAGSVYFYLVRAQNGCPFGDGTAAQRSDGTERVVRECP